MAAGDRRVVVKFSYGPEVDVQFGRKVGARCLVEGGI